MKNLTQLPWSGKGSKAKNDNTLGRMRGGIRSRIGSMSVRNTSLFGIILALLLTFGVGEMWGATWSFSGESYMYFHNKGGWTDSGKMLFIGKDSYSSVYTMAAISNTQLWVVKLPTSGWSDASYMAVAGGGSVWGSGSWGASNRTNATHYTNTYTSGLSTSSTQYYIFIPSSTSNNASISLTYIGNAISNLNKTITVKAKVSSNGGSSYSEATSPGTLSASSKKFTAYNSCASTTSLSSGTISCGYTATTTLTAADATGYDFVGWYNSSGTQQTTNKTLTIYPTANATYYAYYKEKQYSLTFSHNGHGTIAVGSSTISSGSTANVNYTTTKELVATPSTGYNFSGWTKSGSNTGSVTIGNASDASTTIKATNTGATITAGFTPKTTTITLDNQGATTAGTEEVTATFDAAMPSITLPTKTGYTFGGYWGAPGGSGPKYYNADGSSAATWNNENSTYTLLAAWTENMSTVTLTASPSEKGTFTIGGEAATSTTAGVTTTRSVTAVPIAGYSFTGWSITGGASISSTSTNPTTVTGGGAGIAATLTATFVEDLTNYDVTFGVGTSYTSLGSLSATNNSTSSAISSGADLVSGTSVTFTASPNSGYEVAGFYSDASCTSSLQSGNTTTYTIASLSADVTVYVKFQPITYTITYNLNSGTNPGGAPTSYTIESSDVTLPTPTRTNYTFAGWYANSDLSTGGVQTKIASGSTGNKAYWAKWTENMTTVTINVSPADAGTLTVGGAAFTPGNTTTAGVATSRTVVATANSGKVFLDWTVSGNATGTASTNTYTLNGNGSGSTGTLTANFGILSGWNMEGEDFGGWSRPSTYKFTHPYRGMSGVYYIQTTLTKDRWWKVNNGSKPFNATNASTTISKGTIYNLVEEWSNSSKVSSTLSNVWVVINTNDTKKIWVQDQQTFHNVNVSGVNGSKGPVAVTLKTTSAFTKGDNTFTTTQFANGETFTVTVTGVSGWIPTITIGGVSTTFWKEQATYTADGTMGDSDITVTISYTASRALTFAKTTGCSTLTATGPNSTAVTTGTKIKDGTEISFSQSNTTGYTFAKWYSTSTGTGGTQYATTSSYTLTTSSTSYAIYPIYNANNYTITLDVDEDNKGNIASATTGQEVNYNGATTTVPNRPTAANGYALDGYYTDHNGEGTKLINGDGTWIASVDGYTDGSKRWIREGGVTLYAYYKAAEITGFSLSGGEGNAITPSTSTTVTATISPTPTGTTHIDWKLRHYNDNEYTPQPSLGTGTTTSTFTTPATSGSYKLEAVLRLGSTANAGKTIDSVIYAFQVAGDHTVTVQYKCGDDVIKESTEITGRPLSWSDDITAPTIFGYTFSRWDAGDGVTIKNGESDPVTTSTDATIKIKAIYDGRLTAVYTQKSLIYFKNTLGWSDVYVNFYTASDWDPSDNGSGSHKGAGNKNVTNRNKHMTQIGETDIWYYDYGYNGGGSSITPSLYVSFTNLSQGNVDEFWGSGDGINVVYPANYADAIDTDKSSENGFKAATPMFVPLASQDPVAINVGGGGKANYYNAGYWTKYTAGTGYTLEIYNEAGNSFIKSVEFTSEDELMPMKAVVDLEAGQTYKFQLRRGGYDSYGIYYGNSGTMTYASHGSPIPWDMTNSSFSMCGITTNAAGDYTFNLSYSGHAAVNPHYRLRMAVDYPIASGDYRLIYKDNKPTWKPSSIVSKVNNGKDTVSFFIRKASSPNLRIQKSTVANDGTITWAEYPTAGTPTNQITGTIAAAITQDSVYNFCLVMDENGDLTVEKAEPYTGNFYIRTDAANSKWDNYRSDPDHLMHYSDYSERHAGYSHYYTHWVDKDDAGRKNVMFCIANDYSPCISDTLIRETASGAWANIGNYITSGGELSRSANVRFMWNRHDNTISRAYIDGSYISGGSDFLTIKSADSKILNLDDVVQTTITFSDNGNWLYEANVKAKPNAQIKLQSNWGTGVNIITQYFIGTSTTTETLIGGSGTDPYTVRLLYDFKTNRLVTSWTPSGNITEATEIHADVMFVREHQGDINQITFSGSGSISEIKTAYGVLKFNKWTLNNKDKSTHNPLGSPLSGYERSLYWISFPFRVSMEEVFGFGTYGTHWLIEEYDGQERADKGYWADSQGFWKMIWNRKGKYFEPNKGYVIALDLDQLGESSSVWQHTDMAELYFPSYGTMSTITSSSVTHTLPEHTYNKDAHPTHTDDRSIKDSHWNLISVPTYVNTTALSVANTDWTNDHPNYLYEWNADDNTLSARSADGFTFKAMHAYMVQYYGNVTWATSVSPSAPLRQNNIDNKQEVEFRLDLQQGEQTTDRTYVRLSNDEQVSAEFAFGEDLSKEFNAGKANIYTFIANVAAAGNCLPLSDQTTVVPVGVKIAANGDYTFAIPEGTEGVGVTLIDQETGIRTSLSALDYTVSLEAGTYDERFVLEISPIHKVPTEESAVSSQQSDVRKVLINGLLYIVRDNKMYDARGALVTDN